MAMTTDSVEAARFFDAGVADYLDYRLIAGQRLKDAIEADEQFVMAHCFRSALMLMLETVSVVPRIQKNHAELDARRSSVTPREQNHIDALGAWARGDFRSAMASWDAILYAHPHDILALKLHHYLTFWTGRPNALRSTVE
jgi:hypothetical protein